MSERVPLILLPRELRRLKLVERVPSYRTTYNAAVDGRFQPNKATTVGGPFHAPICS